MDSMKAICVKPIGTVQHNHGKKPFDGWKELESDLVIDEKYQEALFNLDQYSHIEVIYHLHEVEEEFIQKVHPTGNQEYPLMGAFTTRTPNRPSKIALTTCKITGIKQNIITVKGLDAFNGSPILDIKPVSWRPEEYHTMPSWHNKIRKKDEKED